MIHAGDGNDTIIGGRGADSLFGEAGADTFDFNKTFESGKGAAHRDTIQDFESGVDKIDLRTIDANTLVNGDQKFTIIKNQPFHHKAGELHALNKGFLILEGDTNGDGKADFQIKIVGSDIAVHDILR